MIPRSLRDGAAAKQFLAEAMPPLLPYVRDEELDRLRAEQYTAMVAQRRQLELSKLHEGQRLRGV